MKSFSIFARTTLCLAVALFVLAHAPSAQAQNRTRINHVVTLDPLSGAPYLGRDLWFGVPQNFSALDNSKKDFVIYVTAEKNTVVNIQQSGQAFVKKPVTAGSVMAYNINPGSTQLLSSGVVDKTRSLHVWSDNADLSVYFISRNAFTSDGMFVIPSIGWGKEYVVAAYAALSVNTTADYPSEFVIVANQDNTTLTIVPTQDIRADGQPDVILHPKNVPFTDRLNRGDVIQYQTTRAKDETYDLTGTVITSNNPIGVIGASQCPFIPVDAPYCDHILDMIPPVRTWSNTYYSVPFAGRKYGGDTYLVIGSKAGQLITRNGAQFATLGKYQPFFNQDVTGASAWKSDAPFMLVQYVNSASYAVPPSQTRNQGDPAMVVVNPAEQFAKKVVFQTPTISAASGQPKFQNFINVLLPISSESKTTFDGKPIANPGTGIQVSKLPIPGTTWEGIRLTYTTRGAGEGTHTVKSDTGIGVYVYGYSTDDSYAWAGALGTKTPNDPDTIPPVVLTPSDCFCATISTNDIHLNASKLSSVVTDTLANVDFYPDPNFIPGSGADSTYYQFCISDSTKEAYIAVSIYDIAGNRTSVVSTYQPRISVITPPVYNFGTGSASPSYGYVWIKNNGNSPFHYDPLNLSLKNGKIGFKIDSAGTTSDIPVGDSVRIRVEFLPVVQATVRDTVLFGDECTKTSSQLLGNGGAPDFVVDNYDFDCTPINSTKPSIGFKIYNPSGGNVTIDSIWVEDPIHFGYNTTTPPTNAFPFVVPKQNILVQGSYDVEFTFTPTGAGNFKTAAHFLSKAVGEKIDTLFGKGCSPLTVSRDSIQDLRCDGDAVFVVPIQNIGNQVDSIISVTGTGPAAFSAPFLTDYLGNAVTLPYPLNDPSKPSNIMYATVQYTSPVKANGTLVDPIVVKRSGGQTATTATLTVNAQYSEGTVDQNIVYGTLPFGSTVKEDFALFCNHSNAPFDVTSVVQLPSTYFTSFSLSNKYDVNGTQIAGLPATLQPGDCMKIYATFDPKISPDLNQIGNFEVTTDACVLKYPFSAQASTSQGIPVVSGFTAPTVLSCSNLIDSITVSNPTGSAKEIRAISFIGVNAANFAFAGTYPIPMPVGSTVRVPIRFTPNPAQNIVSYIANPKVTMHDLVTNVDYFDSSAVVKGFGAGISIKVSSVLAQLQASAGTQIILPVNLEYTKQGGITAPIDLLDVKKIELVYSYTTELLDIANNDVDVAFRDRANGWTVDKANSSVDPVTNTMKITLVNIAPLTDAVTTIGRIYFNVMLTPKDSMTNIELVSSKFYTSAGTEVPACAVIADVDSNFTLIYRCGDATLRKLMLDGKYQPSVIAPAKPNPVKENFVTLAYATRFEGRVSLVIYDELGNTVGRPIMNTLLPAGMYEVHYDASKLGSGTYTYRLQLDNHVTSARFVVQK